MADIKQAAKWISEGRRVTRKGWACPSILRLRLKSRAGIVWEQPNRNTRMADLDVNDLLADDWEIAE